MVRVYLRAWRALPKRPRICQCHFTTLVPPFIAARFVYKHAVAAVRGIRLNPAGRHPGRPGRCISLHAARPNPTLAARPGFL
jgi:hypothetical protein